ncbi:Slp family lipoprotein [Acidithiobacillus sp.]|uniref:Slp family lipoprotein n=1 Tax=Acidithiobacillus sp. TaxID=1872118 RepID=UPI0025BE0760|nr:Slp family lipoprotein [Acidithiobacillus sp.]MCK9188539.1 Slp family lipoprotein [Acidithiobacillus sp.]MCK9360455.1 Slp family lipoprotein [Acidithiobacillus sp.]
MNILKALTAVIVAIVLGGCETVTPVSGQFPPITPHQAQAGAEGGKLVRWGGTLIQAQPKAQETCFTVMALPLRQDGRPYLGQKRFDEGRFIACAPGFYDPVLYAAGREITFVGTVTGVHVEKIGGYEYPYPNLQASTVYLWPVEEPEPTTSTVFINGGWYGGPWGPWGWWGGPGWGWR